MICLTKTSRTHDIPPFPIPYAVWQNHSCHGSSRHHFLITLPAPLDYILDLDLWCNTQVVILFSNLELDADSCTSMFDFGLLEWFGPPWISRLWGKHEVVGDTSSLCYQFFRVRPGQCDICHIFDRVLDSKVCLVWWMFVPQKHRLFTGNLCVQSPKRDLGTYQWEKEPLETSTCAQWFPFVDAICAQEASTNLKWWWTLQNPITSWEW